MSREKVIALAEADLGYTESPKGSNRCKYWDYFDKTMQGQPWCVAAQWTWFNLAGERMAFFGGGKTARCTVLLEWYEKQGLTVPVNEVDRGDIVLLNFNGKGTADHCGLVTEAVRDAAGNLLCVLTVEGNTTPGLEGSQDNGGCVASKERYRKNIVAVCRPQYKEQEEPAMKDDITGHWSEKYARWEMDNKISNGYPDGTYRPDQTITRGEDAAKLYRYHTMVEEELAELRKEIARLREEIKK